jgi:peptide/nickel transport system substrate-binding protein
MEHSVGKRRWLRVSTILAATAVFVAACGTTTTGGGETPKNGGTLVWAIDSDATSLNPFVISTLPEFRIMSFLLPNLYSIDKNLNVVPDLADGFPSVSSDGTVWTVKTKKNAKWSDGSPIGADDVIATEKIQADPNLDTDYGYDWGKVKTVEKVDANTVKFTLSEPFAPFLAVNLVGYIAPASVYGKLDPAKLRNDPVSKNPTVFGGPYKLDKWIPGQEFDFSANLNYFGGRPHYDKVIAKVITDATAATNALINNDVAWHPSLGEGGAGAVSKAKQSSNVVVHTYQDLSYIDFRMNQRKGHIWDKLGVRQALASVLDKAAIVQAATQGAGAPLWGDIVPASWAYNPNAIVKYPLDVNKAKQYMKDAGWTIGADGVAVRTLPDGCSTCTPKVAPGGQQKFVANIKVRAGKPDRLKAAEIIAEQVKQIGMQLTPTPTDFKVFYPPIQKGEFEVFIAGFSLNADPDDYTTASSTQLQPEHKQGQNWTGYSNPELDKLIDQERATVKATDAETKAARKQIFDKIEKIVSGDLQTYMLWADVSSMGWSSNVGGIVAGNGDNTIYYDSEYNVSARAEWFSKSGK